MKPRLIVIVGLLSWSIIISAQGQKEFFSIKDTIYLNLVTIKAVNFFTTRDEMIKCLGKPDSIVNPNYECGGFSAEWQQKEFLQYYYGGLNFIGSEESYQIEAINFDQDSTISLYYKDFTFSSQTRIDQVCQIFPKSCNNRTVDTRAPDQEIIKLLLYPLSDDSILFYFNNGKLVRMEYYTPC